ncbi:MAG TPA: hypothetical protein VJ890_08475 [Vineibacter sp.]|nr:hypothetical protein [Vineibacter sp.]
MEFIEAQIQEAIEALEREMPGAWQQMVNQALGVYTNVDIEREVARSCAHAMITAFHDLPLVRDSADPYDAKYKLMFAVQGAALKEAERQNRQSVPGQACKTAT